MHEQNVMPPFQGTSADRAAISAYLMLLHGHEVSADSILAANQPVEETGEEVTVQPDSTEEVQP
jgi:hypothetical protein